MKSRIFVLMSTITVFALLGIRIRVAAQVEQKQPNNRTDYFVKNLDTLEDTGTVVKCISNASLVFADTRPPQYSLGYCAIYRGTGKLNGECLGRFLGPSCSLRNDPKQCPPGALPKGAGGTTCKFSFIDGVDYQRPCN